MDSFTQKSSALSVNDRDRGYVGHNSPVYKGIQLVNSIVAGLTGYAQVTGVYDTSPYDKLKMDLMYIENYSARMDLQIILMTLKTMLFPGKTNAETEEGVLPCEHQTDKEENDR